MAEAATVPVRIVHLSDAETLEAQLVENLMRRDVHPMEEAQGFRALLNLEEPKYSIEQIAARTGKNSAYIASRLKLTELAPGVVEAFYREEIGVGHARLLAKLQPAQQEQALAACFKEDWSAGGQKPKRILLPVRSLQFWIESNVLLVLKLAPFDKSDAQLVPAASSCVECPLRTGHNKLLFSELGKLDACTDPSCYQAKVDAHIAKTIAAKPKLVQISTAYGQQKEGSAPAAQQVHRNPDREARHQRRGRTTGVQDLQVHHRGHRFRGRRQGRAAQGLRRANLPGASFQAACSKVADDGKWKAEQEKQRREAAIANTTGTRILAAISAAVPVRLMKRDLLFVVERLASMVDENRLAVLAKQHGIKQAKDSDSIGKLFAAYLHRAEESALGRVLVELTILHATARQNAAQVLRDAAAVYKVDTDAIALKVKQEFAAKEKAQAAKKAIGKARPKPIKKTKTA